MINDPIQMERHKIDKRRPVWLALSEFYLDTELAEEDFDRIVQIFNQSDFSLSEIKKIDLYEVFPLLQANLLSPAGVWDGFDEDWLILNCEKLLHKRENRLHIVSCIFPNKLHYWMRKRYWTAIENRMNI